jgi:hypothetical protein
MTKPEALDAFTTRTAWVGDRSVDRMDLHVEQESIFVGPSTSRVIDLDWSYTDRDGHWHAFADDGSHPTLDKNTRRVPTGPDPDEDFYTETWYACSICGQTVKPGFKTKYNDDHIPGMRSWRVEANMSKLPIPRIGEKAVIRLVAGDTTAFGIAVITQVNYEPGTAHVIMMGMGPLAYRHGHDA